MDKLIDGMLALKKVLRQERQQKLLVLAITLSSGLFFGLLGWSMARSNAFFILLSVAALLVGLRFLYDIVREWNPENSALMQCLHYSPNTIVWVYVIEMQLMPAGIRFWKRKTLMIRLVDGNDLQLRVGSKDLIVIKKALVILLPHATFGFSREREQWYRADPRLLYRKKDMD